MKRLILLTLMLAFSICAQGQVSTKEVVKVTTDITGTTTCAQGKLYYNQTSLVNWERNNAGVCAKITAGGTPGDVAGPASSTDNAITRFDGTGGKTVQNSPVTIDDSGSVNIPTGQTYKINNVALAKGDVGLGNVDNTSDVNKPVSTAQQTALDLKANLASPTFTGTPSLPTGTTATTQSAADSTTKLATTAFVTTADNLKANLASPTFTGTVVLPTVTLSGPLSGGAQTISAGVATHLHTATTSWPLILEDGVISTAPNTMGIRMGFTGGTYQKLGLIYEGADGNARGKFHIALNGAASSANVALADSKFNVNYDGTITFNTAIYNTCTGLTTSSGVVACTVSDQRVKSGINPFSGGLATVRKIQPITFQFNKGTVWFKGGREELGLSAQNLKAANPMLASETGNAENLLQPEPMALHAVTIDAIKELDAKFEAYKAVTDAKILALEKENAHLRKTLNLKDK